MVSFYHIYILYAIPIFCVRICYSPLITSHWPLPSPHLHGEGVSVVEGKPDVLQVVGEDHLPRDVVVGQEPVAGEVFALLVSGTCWLRAFYSASADAEVMRSA